MTLTHTHKTLMLLGGIAIVLLMFQSTWFLPLHEWCSNSIQVSKSNLTYTRISPRLINYDPQKTGVYTRTLSSWTYDNVCQNVNSTKFQKAYLHTPLGNTPIFVYNPVVDAFVSKYIIATGSWELELCNLILKLLSESPEAIFLDVGANVGAMTLTAAAMGKRAIAIDALGSNIQRICASVAAGKYETNVTIIHNAVSYSRGIVTMREHVNNVGGSFINENNDFKKSFLQGWDLGRTMDSVTSMRLDDILDLPDIAFKKVVMKLDVEGYERQTLIGADRLFSGGYFHSIIMEWQISARDPQSTEILSYLDNYNMEPYTIDRRPLKITEWRNWPINVLWLRKPLLTRTT